MPRFVRTISTFVIAALGRMPQRLLLLALVAITALALLGTVNLPDGRLHVHFLDIGQGDAVLITTPSGNRAIIDGGPDPSRLFVQLDRFMPFWERRIELVVLSHAHADHMNGLIPLVERYWVGAVLDTAFTPETPLAQPWLEAVERSGAPLYLVAAGAQIDLGDGVLLTVLHPGPQLMRGTQSDINNNSIVLRLDYGNFSALFTGDAELEAEHAMIQHGLPLRALVLKAGHHGSPSSTTPEFVRAVSPKYSVIQVGADNPFGHPAPIVLHNLRETQIFRNDHHGTVTFTSDGLHVWIRSDR